MSGLRVRADSVEKGDEDATIDDVVAEMDRRRVSQIPVVCADEVIGMISRFELITALEHCLSRTEEGAKAR
ncbi:hypothetical protein XI09_12865 [Bradyrhizobium sp. CCBAU 11386]|uniref:CBS domain-containing protein n=1 Tax=Bradyrhizobium sp. CCBAU 11386 TaxID=1630837 RepID=UPI003FA42ABB|nr:hypothetical protein [Bradyrhizobium sp. CCBAU 11386]